MKKLFIAVVSLRTSQYMRDKIEKERVTRLVWAQSEEQAESLIRAALTVESPYDMSTRIEGMDLSEALGVP